MGFRFLWLSPSKEVRLTLIFLKGVGWVSLQYASIVLIEAGHLHEMGILFRCMDECIEDILFFADARGPKGQVSVNQQRAIAEFFQEQFENPGETLSKKRDRLPRQKVRAAIIAPGHASLESKGKEAMKTLYEGFSGFVHGAYPHIMELYGGDPPRYHTSGMQGTPRISEYVEALINYVYRAVVATLLVALRLGEEDISENLLRIKRELEGRFPQLPANGT
ncbi:MAG: hypothetical protein IIA40_14260 [SAR324 cluster bacterium]|nr:hypothetical protein [SAR324 cluster bacterium]